MLISIIAAFDHNRVIGYHNDIPWRLPKDWEYVRNITTGRSIILGRKNFESIGRALPGRRNIILTRDQHYSATGCEVVHSIDDIFRLCEHEEEVFIFGGEQIYRMFMPYVKKMYITKIHHEFEGDTFFPELCYEDWVEVSVEKGMTDEKNPYIYYFHVYERKQSC